METYDAGTAITLTATAQGGPFQTWSGACSGTQTTCTVTLDGPKIVTATFAGQTSSEYGLTVYKAGDGSGTVSSDPFGITIGQIAPYDSAKFPAGSKVTLTASANAGSRFDGWSGACSGTKATCTVNMDSAQSATAIFSLSSSPTATATARPSPTLPASPSIMPTPGATLLPSAAPTAAPTPKATAAPTPLPEFELAITKSGPGSGAIYVWPSGRSQELCGSSDKICAFKYPFNTSFAFQVMPRPGSQFEKWAGDCNGQVCEIALDRPKKLTASFGLTEAPTPVRESVTPSPSPGEGAVPTPPPYIPRPTSAPKPPADGNYPLVVQVTGKGMVKSSDGKIQCNGYCEEKYARFSDVQLTASPAAGWKFVGWGGSCINTEGTECTATIEGSALFVSSTTVRAVFAPENKVLSVGIEGDGWVHSGDTRIFCGSSGRIVYNCAGHYPFESRAVLTANSAAGSTFDRWEGACTGQQPQCSVTMDDSKSVRAVFKGPPSRKRLSIIIPSVVGGSLFVSSYEPGSLIPLHECTTNCTYDFKHGSWLDLSVRTNAGFVWEGFSGSCLGAASCKLTMDADRAVTLTFYKAIYNKLTVVKPRLGTVVSRDSDAIRCGPQADRCVADIDTRKTPVLKFEGAEGDYGLFESGCTTILKRIDRMLYPYEECVLDMNQDRTVKTKPSPEQEKRLVGRAMGWAFGRSDYPGLKEFATREDGVPFQYALAAFRSGKGGSTALEMEKWIKDNWDSFLKDTGIGEFMQEYDIRIVRQTLLKTFGPDLESYKPKSWFKYDAAYNYIVQDTTAKPFIRGMRDWSYYHKQFYQKPVEEFEAYLLNQKQSYFRNEGIEPFFREPEPTPKPPAYPYLSKIQADNDQIGKPVTIIGGEYRTLRKLSIDGNPVDFRIIDDEHVYLYNVRWGIQPDFGVESTITLERPDNTFQLKIYSNQVEPTILNGDGKIEECFGAIGPGCKGSKGKDFQGPGETKTDRRIGCFAEENGERICYTSAGSIRHDNCCVWNPGGKWCGGAGTDGKPAEEWNHNGKCVEAWHEAFWDSALETTWLERYRMGIKPDMSPYPSPYNRYFALEAKDTRRVCASKGTELREAKDAPFCCSGQMDSGKKCK